MRRVYFVPADARDRHELAPLTRRGARPGDRIVLDGDSWSIVRNRPVRRSVLTALEGLQAYDAESGEPIPQSRRPMLRLVDA